MTTFFFSGMGADERLFPYDRPLVCRKDAQGETINPTIKSILGLSDTTSSPINTSTVQIAYPPNPI